MAAKFSSEAKVGFFLVLVVLALIYLTTRINSTGFSFRSMDHYDIQFKNVSGLIPNTPVEYSGIRVGNVEKISLEGGEVVVRIRVKPDVRIYKDSEISLQTRGLLGEMIIMIEGGGAAEVYPPGSLIRTGAGPRTFEEALQDLSEVSASIKDLVKGGEGKASIQDIINNTTDITEDVRSIVRGRRSEIESVVSNMKVVTDSLRDFMDDSDPNRQSALSKLEMSMDKLNDTVDDLHKVIAGIERGEGTVGKLLKDETTVNKLNDALDNVNEFIGSVKQLEIAVGFRGEYMGSEGEPIAVTSFRFRPAHDKYFLLEFTDGPLGFFKKSRTVTTTERNPPGTTVTETETRSSDNFSITAIFARRFWDLTLKAGLFRSSGGFGAEYHLFRDHFSLNAEAFNFSRETRPHLRLFGKLNFLDIFYANGGVDDVLHKRGRRNYFGGLGFILTDDDLKRLFSIANVATLQ